MEEIRAQFVGIVNVLTGIRSVTVNVYVSGLVSLAETSTFSGAR